LLPLILLETLFNVGFQEQALGVMSHLSVDLAVLGLGTDLLDFDVCSLRSHFAICLAFLGSQRLAAAHAHDFILYMEFQNN
jgi:hypothetical protein